MNPRLVGAVFLISVFAPSFSQAGPVFNTSAAPPPGTSSGIGNAGYYGINNVGGSVTAAQPFPGISGNNTPLNSGNSFYESAINFSILGNSGYFDIGSGFTSVITSSAVTATGGGFTFTGFLSTDAAAFFGLSADTQMVGTATLTLSPAFRPGGSNSIASLFATFSPNSVPEPSSMTLVVTGVLGLMAFGLGRARRGERPASTSEPDLQK